MARGAKIIPHQNMVNGKQGIVFISCGQYRNEEIALGKALAQAVTDTTAFEGYFAENQTSLDGLSQNIFGALNRCTGFVGVMHHRGTVKTLHGELVRASVWVEQELAIAAFLRQAQGRHLAVAVYIQKGIQREGVRDKLLLGPVEFDTEVEVLSDFKARLADGRFAPVRLVPPKDVSLELGFQTIGRGSGAVHQYRLQLRVTNTGSQRLDDYWIELQFPKAVLNSGAIWGAVGTRVTDTHTFLRQTRDDMGRDLYPGDTIDAMVIDYHMDDGLYENGSVLRLPVIARVGAPGMEPKEVERPFRELQEY